MDNKNRDGVLGPPPIDDNEISFKNINHLDISFKEFMPGQIIQSGQFNDDMKDIEEKVNEICDEHNTVAYKLKEHLTFTNNPHKVTAHQTGTYTSREIDEFVQDVKNGNLYDNAITNRVLDDDCVDNRGEILDQMRCFRLSVGEIFVGGNLAKDEGSFHIVQIYGKCNYKKCNYKKCNHKKCKNISWGGGARASSAAHAAPRRQRIGPIGRMGPIGKY